MPPTLRRISPYRRGAPANAAGFVVGLVRVRQRQEAGMPAEKRDLTRTVVAVTGASSGIGAATARLLGEAGACLVLGARRLDRLHQLVSELGSERALAVELDVRDPDQCRAFVDAG